jgi:hypothetical protein
MSVPTSRLDITDGPRAGLEKMPSRMRREPPHGRGDAEAALPPTADGKQWTATVDGLAKAELLFFERKGLQQGMLAGSGG